MKPSSRTPEGEPNRCPVCGKDLRIEPSRPAGDAPCPHCGHLVWFGSNLSVDRFLRLVRDSKLVDKRRLKRAVASIREERLVAPVDDAEFVGRKLVEFGLLTDWQCRKLLEGRWKGFFLGKYKLTRHLAVGRTTSIYLAEHVLMQRTVVIKVVAYTLNAIDPSYPARLMRKAQAAAALNHKNIVRDYDVDKDGLTLYMVVEYVDGENLAQVVAREGVLPIRTSADYIRQAAEGLHCAHRAGLIHRDVKPAHLLLDRNGVVKVLDLGFARFTDDVEIPSVDPFSDRVLSTVDYLAPEQAIDRHRVDPRADIYSLGCTMFYLLTGRPPFPEGTLPQKLMRHQNAQPPDVRATRTDAPEELVRICTKMMAKRPEDRFQTVGAVAQALGDWLREDEGEASGNPVPRPTPPPVIHERRPSDG